MTACILTLPEGSSRLKASDSVAICKQPLPECSLQWSLLTNQRQFEGCRRSIGATKTTIKRSFCSSDSFRMRRQYIHINQYIKHASRHLDDFYHVVRLHFIMSFGRFLPRDLAFTLRSRTQRKPPKGNFSVPSSPFQATQTDKNSAQLKTLQAARTRTACSTIHQRSGCLKNYFFFAISFT